MSARRGIVTGGTWCVDRNIVLDHWPGENGLAVVQSTEDANGGSASNLAIDMRKLDPGLPVGTISVTGGDAAGQLLLDIADRNGIDRTHIKVLPEETTQLTYCFTSLETRQRTHITTDGANDQLTPDHFDFDGLNHKIFHLGLLGVHKKLDSAWEDDANGWVSILKKARAAGLMNNLELCSIGKERLAVLVRPCLPHLDMLVVNDFEIGAVSGSETLKDGETDVEACEDAARSVLAMGVSDIVAVHFPGGALVVTSDGLSARKPSVRVPEAENAGANGAGDAFAAGFLYGVHENWDLDRSLTLAHAAAAASLRTESTVGAVETWRKCLNLAEQWGWRDTIT